MATLYIHPDGTLATIYGDGSPSVSLLRAIAGGVETSRASHVEPSGEG